MEAGSVIKVAGLDPALRNFAIVLADIEVETGNVRITDMNLTVTQKDPNKLVRTNSSDLRRATELHGALKTMCSGVQVIFSEIPSGAQSANAAKAFGIAIGVIAAAPAPVIQLLPKEVKTVTGIPNASKGEMINWAVNKHPDAAWLKRKRGGNLVLTNANEHLADAVATIHAGIFTDQFSQLLSLYRNAKVNAGITR